MMFGIPKTPKDDQNKWEYLKYKIQKTLFKTFESQSETK